MPTQTGNDTKHHSRQTPQSPAPSAAGATRRRRYVPQALRTAGVKRCSPQVPQAPSAAGTKRRMRHAPHAPNAVGAERCSIIPYKKLVVQA